MPKTMDFFQLQAALVLDDKTGKAKMKLPFPLKLKISSQMHYQPLPVGGLGSVRQCPQAFALVGDKKFYEIVKKR